MTNTVGAIKLAVPEGIVAKLARATKRRNTIRN
jgi:hypothetical protein